MHSDLPSWNDNTTRKTILDFVARATDPESARYVPPEQRIATFDNDGTLWSEQPMVQGDFIMQRLVAMADKDPSLRQIQPWKMAYDGDTSWIGEATARHYRGDDADVKLLLGGVVQAFSAMSVEAFQSMAANFFEKSRHPVYGCSYLEVVYQPMLELLDLLARNAFTTYVVSGGGRDFMRPVTQQLYNIPPERVIGSAPTMSFQADDQGARVMREAGLGLLDDGPAKPVEIWRHTGQRPIFAAGNANGDVPMLQFAGGQDLPALRLLVHHDDAAREVAYDAGAEQALALAAAEGWAVVSMEKDWKRVFAFQGS